MFIRQSYDIGLLRCNCNTKNTICQYESKVLIVKYYQTNFFGVTYMISFSVLNTDNSERIISEKFSKEEISEVNAVLSDLDLSFGLEYGVSSSHGCLIVRICDAGRYVFSFPIALSKNADVKAALTELEKYVIKEELMFNLCSLSYESLPCLRSYLHVLLDAEDESGEIYFAKIQNECQLITEIPVQVGGRVTLNALTSEDIPSYARLCRDVELLKYWGYDYRLDYPQASDSFFFETQKRDFELGTAMTMAIRDGERLVGSLEFYAFDFHGGAELDIRIFPSKQRRGYAKEALELSFGAAREIGLVRLYARVMNRNAPSCALFEKYADKIRKEKESNIYTFILSEHL